jgi:hypothetical protein
MNERTDPNTRQAPGNAPSGPQDSLEGGSGTREAPEGENEAHAGADGLTPWSQLEARAFNAVQPALQESGAWLPMSVRRAVAKAVLAAVQPHLAGHYQHAVDAAVAAEQRTNQAEALLRRYRDWLANQHARAEAADQAGGVPPELRISPHNGIAAGLRTALHGLDRILAPAAGQTEEQP